MGRKARRAKRQYARKPLVGECGCVSRQGVAKTLFAEHWQASSRAGDTMGGKMWQIYKCPNPDVEGYHITTLRWDPWNLSAYHSPEAAQ